MGSAAPGGGGEGGVQVKEGEVAEMVVVEEVVQVVVAVDERRVGSSPAARQATRRARASRPGGAASAGRAGRAGCSSRGRCRRLSVESHSRFVE